MAECNVTLAALFALLDSGDKKREAQAQLYIPGDKICLKMEDLSDPAGLSENKYKAIGAVLVDAPGAVVVPPVAAAVGGGGGSGGKRDTV